MQPWQLSGKPLKNRYLLSVAQLLHSADILLELMLEQLILPAKDHHPTLQLLHLYTYHRLFISLRTKLKVVD